MLPTFRCRHGANSHLAGLIYVHRIDDARVSGGTSQRNMRMFRKLCGTDSLKNVVIVTTMWDKVTSEERPRREQELKSSDNLFKPLLDGGAVMMRHERTTETANKVISHLLRKSSTVSRTVRELVEGKKTSETTSAGGELHSDIEELMKKRREEMESFKAEMKLVAQTELAEEKQKMNHRLAKLMAELDELKRGITVPITECVSEHVQNNSNEQLYLSDLPPEFEPIWAPQSSPNRNQLIGNDSGDRVIASVYWQMLQFLLELIIDSELWALQRPGSPLSVILCSDNEFIYISFSSFAT